MPSRADMPCVPEGAWNRSAWLEENLRLVLEQIPMALGWAGIARMEQQFFPRTPLVRDALGGPLDPTCPACGLETDEGTVKREGKAFLVSYQSCGHEIVMTAHELEQRIRHAGES